MPWDSNRYLAKAQLYWERATGLERDSEDFLLFVAFVCEFLARARLVRTNAALNAASDPESILFASGVEPKTPAKSVDLIVGLDRVQRIVPEITDDEIVKIKLLISARNAELHSDESGMASLEADTIMPAVYGFLVKTCNSMPHSPMDLLGVEDGTLATQVHNAGLKDRKKRIGDLIRVQKERFFSQTDKEQNEARERARVPLEGTARGHPTLKAKCPCCAEVGLLAGQIVGRSRPILKDDEIVEEVRISPSAFTCRSCEIVIKGLDELMAAGFSHEMHATASIDPVEHFSIDPMDYVDIDKVIRDYHAAEEYMDE